jgi:serine/threonine protein kinase
MITKDYLRPKKKSKSLDNLNNNQTSSEKFIRPSPRKRVASCISNVTPPTPSKKRTARHSPDIPVPLFDEKYENIICIRRNPNGPTKSIYSVTNKVSLCKLCVKEISDEDIQKEYRFARDLSSIPHPNIVKYHFVQPNLLESFWYRLGSYDQYSVTTLHNKPPNSIALLSHFKDLASGLELIQSFKFVHLDLKPANIFVGNPAHGEHIPPLLIGDFGTMVEAGTLLDDDQEGDGKYIAPEVFQDDYKASIKFDIYSLALCMVEIATAEPMTNTKWNEFQCWEEENREILRFENMCDEVFLLIPMMLSRNPSKRPNASEILPIIQAKLDQFKDRLHEKKISFAMKDLLEETSQMAEESSRYP